MVGRREAAEAELARRELARRRLMDFAEFTFPQYQAAGVHRLLAEYLEQVERYVATGGREGIGRLMVFMPPRTGKSELVSVRFPAWFLGRNPEKRVILSSCTADLAVGFSRQVRNIVQDTLFQGLFGELSSRERPIVLAEDSRAANTWDLGLHRGGMVAAGVGGAIIGRGAHLAIIDDPFKDRNDAESQAVRDRVDAWYRSTLYTRLEDGAAVVLMHQRWHEDDLAGRLLKRMVEGKTLTPGPSPWEGEGGKPRDFVRGKPPTTPEEGEGGKPRDFVRGKPPTIPEEGEKGKPKDLVGGKASTTPEEEEDALTMRPTDEKVDQWVVLCLPAVAEDWAQGVSGDEVIEALRAGWWRGVDALGRQPGDALWPEKYPLESLGRIEANVGGYEWEALYQQRPRRLEGAVIKAHLIKLVDEMPEGARLARYWDLAVSGKDRADWIAGALVGRTRDGRIWIGDVVRLRGPWADARPHMVAQMLRDGVAVEQGIEVQGQQGGYCQELQRDEQLTGIAVRGVNPQAVGNKEVRANVWASRIEDDLVRMVRGPWNEAFVAECIAFPRGAHDDQVDGVSGAVQMLPAMVRMSEVRQAESRQSRWDVFGEGGPSWGSAVPGRVEMGLGDPRSGGNRWQIG